MPRLIEGSVLLPTPSPVRGADSPPAARPRRWLALAAATVAIVMSMAFTTGIAHGATTNPTAPLGAYVGAANPSGLAAFGKQYGVKPTVALDFVGYGAWSDMDNFGWDLAAHKGQPYTLVLSVPLFPNGGSLKDAAAGKYNAHYQGLAEQLKAYGRTADNTIIRLAWELNGNWEPWSGFSDPASFKAGWKQAVDTMRAVIPGLRFDWCVSNGASTPDPSPLYPGDDYVDIIGNDIYDQTWQDLKTNPTGLNWLATFAAAHGKPISFPEWGLDDTGAHGRGDDPAFIDMMADFIATHDVAYQSYFNVDVGDGAHLLENYPSSAARYTARFGGNSQAVPPASSTTPPASTPPATTTTTTTPPATSTTTTTGSSSTSTSRTSRYSSGSTPSTPSSSKPARTTSSAPATQPTWRGTATRPTATHHSTRVVRPTAPRTAGQGSPAAAPQWPAAGQGSPAATAPWSATVAQDAGPAPSAHAAYGNRGFGRASAGHSGWR
jgi:hypothetical protein